MKVHLYIYENYNLGDLSEEITKDEEKYNTIDTSEVTLTHKGNGKYSAVAIFKCTD